MSLYNNELLGILVFQEFMYIKKETELYSLMLLLPIVFHQKSLSYLSNKKTKVISIQNLILTKPEILVSLNKRYYNFLPNSINCLSLCLDNGFFELKDGKVFFLKRMFNENDLPNLGNRALKIQASIMNLVSLLSSDSSQLYELCGVEL
ncbi:DUF6521 family protein [Orbus wheelerorum]|uniref:three component ABC system middle component n=1 Tax=Orbus wheelerorum TaxID=3074111 RepID=UPI00370DAABC